MSDESNPPSAVPNLPSERLCGPFGAQTPPVTAFALGGPSYRNLEASSGGGFRILFAALFARVPNMARGEPSKGRK